MNDEILREAGFKEEELPLGRLFFEWFEYDSETGCWKNKRKY